MKRIVILLLLIPIIGLSQKREEELLTMKILQYNYYGGTMDDWSGWIATSGSVIMGGGMLYVTSPQFKRELLILHASEPTLRKWNEEQRVYYQEYSLQCLDGAGRRVRTTFLFEYLRQSDPRPSKSALFCEYNGEIHGFEIFYKY